MINQLSIFLENAKGKLSEITRILADANVDFLALTIADTTDFGILRTIVNNEEAAVKALKDSGHAVSVNSVLAVVCGRIIRAVWVKYLMYCPDADISIEYLYSFVRKPKENALMIFKWIMLKKAIDVLNEKNIPLLNRDDLV